MCNDRDELIEEAISEIEDIDSEIARLKDKRETLELNIKVMMKASAVHRNSLKGEIPQRRTFYIDTDSANKVTVETHRQRLIQKRLSTLFQT